MTEYRHAADDLRERLPRHVREDLAAHPNVIGTGIGPRRVDGERTDEAAIVVFVLEKHPLKTLDDGDRLPAAFSVGDEEVPVDVQAIGGDFEAMSAHPGSGSDTRSEYVRPFMGGVEVGRVGGGSPAASSTARVDNEEGDSFIILSRHAVGYERAYPEGEGIYSPPVEDTPVYRLGEVVESSDWAYGTKWNRSDAALVEVSERTVSGDYLGHGSADDAGRPDLDRRCVQFSAVDGIVGGEVLAEDVVTEVSYDFGTLTFQDLIVTDLPGTPGSSGGVVAQHTADGDLRIIGQHIAGSAGAGLVQPWNSLEREFDMRLIPA